MSELVLCIKKLNNSKSNDPTGIINFILKKLPQNLLQGLLKLYNKCLTENFMPSEWKTAEITMIPKKRMINLITTIIVQSAKHNFF
jgi:hypothetical protein